MPDGTIACPTCGDIDTTLVDVDSIQAPPPKNSEKKKSKKFIKITLVSILMIIIAVVVPSFISNQKLDGNDKIAFDALILNIHNFKNPESIRVLGGYVDEDSNYVDKYGYLVYLRVTGTNGFGGTISGYYSFRSESKFYMDFTNYISKGTKFYEQFNSRDLLGVKKINKALDEYWGK